jgi:hypothetical protein
MAEAGLFIRRRDDRDNRLVRLWLTDAGRALREPIEAVRRSREEKVTADLTRPEREHLLRALAKIHRSAADLLLVDDLLAQDVCVPTVLSELAQRVKVDPAQREGAAPVAVDYVVQPQG